MSRKLKRKRKPDEYDIALRPFHHSSDRKHASAEDLDDIVVRSPTMFRAEMMDDNQLWMCCYMDDDFERVNFWVYADKHGHITVTVTEWPAGDYVYEPGSIGPNGPVEA